MATYTFKLGKDVAFKCNAPTEESAWQAFSERKQLSIEYLQNHYKIKKV
jgi:hypothetical protein